jgi:hypothetical protein
VWLKKINVRFAALGKQPLGCKCHLYILAVVLFFALKIGSFMKLHSRLLYILVFVWMGVGLAVAQPKDTMPSGAGGYLPIDENYIMETKWRYTYTTHTQTNTIIHRADNSYDYYVYFKYDHTYQNF